MDANKLRRIAGIPTLPESVLIAAEAKKKEVMAPSADAEIQPPTEDTDDLPAIVTKIAENMAKKFGFGSADDSDSKDLQAAKDFLMKVYNAGVADGEAKASVKE